MQRLDGRLIHSASDLVSFLQCARLAVLNLDAALKRRVRPQRRDPVLELLSRRGGLLEEKELTRWRDSGRSVAVVECERNSTEAFETGAQKTKELMRSGVEVIVQGVLFDGDWIGFADALERVDKTSSLGSFSYEVVDVKLASKVRPGALIQTAQYTAQLAEIQGLMPATLHVIRGDGSRQSVPTASVMAYYRRVREAYLSALVDAGGADGFENALAYPESAAYPWLIDTCGTCPWQSECQAQREADDHLTLVPGMVRTYARRLITVGVPTRRALAQLDTEGLTTVSERSRTPETTLDRLRKSATHALRCAQTGVDRATTISHLPLQPWRGVWKIMPPGPGDVCLHIEHDPLHEGRRFAFVAALQGVNGRPTAMIATTLDEERQMFRTVVKSLQEAWNSARSRQRSGSGSWGNGSGGQGQAPRVYVYGASTVSELQRLSGQFSHGGELVAKLITGDCFTDLRSVVRDAVLLPRPINALGDMDRYTGFAISDQTQGPSADVDREPSLLETFESLVEGDVSAGDALQTGAMRTLERIAMLRDWLRARQSDLPRQRDVSVQVHETPLNASEAETQFEELKTRILALQDVAPRGGAPGSHACKTLETLLSWHRRERLVDWWEYAGVRALTEADLIESDQAISGLVPEGTTDRVVGGERRTFRFPAAQEHKLRRDSEVEVSNWPTSSAVRLVSIDARRGKLVLQAPPATWASLPSPVAITRQKPIHDRVLRDALARVADTIVADDLANPDASGRYQATRRLLAALPPVPNGHAGGPLGNPGETGSETAVRLATVLTNSVVAIQGPPGTGKTHTGAQMILALLRKGRTVGITATSHRAITNLLDKTMELAEASGETGLVRAIQRGSGDDRCKHPAVEITGSNITIETVIADGSMNLIAGTPWVFSRPALDGTLDALFIDEAGQMTLANAVAASTAAKQIFLLGDPQQLAQPIRGTHPDGTRTSALDHILEGRVTIPDTQGVFLETSYRMHPAICQFVSDQFYEGRLRAQEACGRQEIDRFGAGLRVITVSHEGNRTDASEEVAAITQACNALIGSRMTSSDGKTTRLASKDIMVVAPYNRQVSLLEQLVPLGVQCGTVDRFQGQEAPVVFFSMTASDGAELSRGLEFLFSPNRLNVAISRAKILAVLVCSPNLLAPRCNSAEEVHLANTMCHLAETATAFQKT